jgi:arabinose-5-phosphate isomerase
MTDAMRNAILASAGAIGRLVDPTTLMQMELAVGIIRRSSGRVVTCGVGKSGHVARKLAATLSSTGTPAFFLHPVEGAHGDLGAIAPHDVLIVISNSGNSAELRAVLVYANQRGHQIIAITGDRTSDLGAAAAVCIVAHVAHEGCPLGLAPMASAAAAAAIGDAIAAALIEARGFSRSDFAATHPSGALAAA